MRPESSTGLYWSIRGAILCVDHSKEVDEHRWIVEEWQPVPESSQGSDITSANGARQTGPHSHQPSITTAQAPVSRRQLTSAIATVRSLTARVQASSANSGADVAEIRER